MLSLKNTVFVFPSGKNKNFGLLGNATGAAIMTINVKIKRTGDAKMPSYAHPGDAGVDLYAADNYILKPMQRQLISTGLKMAIPPGYEGQVRPKSGLSAKHGLSVVNTPGTIDSGYRGEVMIILINLGQEEYRVEKGTKVAQLVFKKVETADFQEVEDLDETSRNEGGFGSTGIN